MLTGDQVLGAESVRRHVEELKTNLLGPRPTRIDQILIGAVAVRYLAARHAAVLAAQPGTCSLGQAALRLRRCESAERRLQRALKNLVLLRAKASEGLAPRSALRLYPGEEEQRERA